MSARLAAAILLMASAGTAASAELGRLFFTPAQRATLDSARKQNIRVNVGNEEEQAQAAPVPQSMSVNGVVRRSDGKNTVWLNNRAVTNQQPTGVNVSTNKRNNRVKLTVPESGRSVDLKVGQTIEIVSGTISESYLRPPVPKPEATPAVKPAATSAESPKPQTAAAQRRRTRDAQDQFEPGPAAQADPAAPAVVAPAENKPGPY